MTILAHETHHRPWLKGVILLIGLAVPTVAAAQTFSLDLGTSSGASERALQLIAVITLLSLAPAILIMVTSFTRIVVVLSLLRSAFGTQTAPPNTVIVSLALFLTAFVMAPTARQIYADAIEPFNKGTINAEGAVLRATGPLRVFMLAQVREKDLELFIDMSGETKPATPDATPMLALVPAFMISELRRAFEIGFLLFMPFLIIDLAVASILMAVGMMMLPPTTISLPFKLIFFVLVDGWSLVAGSLVKSYMN